MNRQLVFVGIIAGCIAQAGCQKPTVQREQPKSLTAESVAENNRGVGLMARFDYAAAYDVFAKLVKEHPANNDFKVNLAVATLNRQQATDLTDAQKLLADVLKADPKHVRANYCLGLLKLFNTAPGEALPHFQAVQSADPHDAYVSYQIGQCYSQMDQPEKALAAYEKAIEADSYLRSAYYSSFQVLQRMGRPDDAKPMLNQFQKLEHNPQARLAEFKYTRMGPKAMTLPVSLRAAKPIAALKGPLFAEPVELTIEPADFVWPDPGDKSRLSVTTCDVDGNGAMDLFLAGYSGEKAKPVLLLAPDSSGKGEAWKVAADHPLAQVTAVNAVLWGDYDNDGLVDAYLCRRGANQLWRQTEAGKWEDATESTGTGGGELNTVDGAMVDADHDGDLDIYIVNADGPNELLSNNHDGAFRPLGETQQLAGNGQSSRQVLFNDLDRDRDADIVVLHDQPPHEVYRNDLSWAWEPAEGFQDFVAAELHAIVTADADANGQMELYTASARGLERWTPDDGGVWQASVLIPADKLQGDSAAGDSHWQLAIADVDGDTVLDAIVGTGNRWNVVRLAATPKVIASSSGAPKLAAWQPIVRGQGGTEIFALRDDGQPMLSAAGSARHPLVAIELSGKELKADQMRSNRSGIGVRLVGRIGSRYSVIDTYRNSSGPGQSIPLATIGTAGQESIDYVIFTWPDGLLQSELALKPGEVHKITEVQRQMSSCPVLFVRNGERYEFVTDLLGVGGLGFAIGDGSYVPPTPRENLLLPQGMLKSTDGKFRLKLVEPMEEACYLDSARLVAYDLPPGWQMTLDERCSTGEPTATGEPRFYRTWLLPRQAVNDRGDNVTRLVTEADDEPAPPGRRDLRFIGRTAEHSIVLTFAEDLAGKQGQPMLLADGWVEYPYSQTMFAAWQAGASYDAPTIEAQDGAGAWHTLHARVGYPGGMRRQMSLPLGQLPPGCRTLRIRTNLEIYWDRLAIAWDEPCSEAKKHVLRASDAALTHVGFPRRTDGPMRQVNFDYSRRTPSADIRFQRGHYTDYGSMTPLVTKTDDAVAIFGPGEEIELSFNASLASVDEGWSRRYVLETTGWCKDMDLYTQHGETVEPLPLRDENSGSTAERDALHRQFNTRYMSGD